MNEKQAIWVLEDVRVKGRGGRDRLRKLRGEIRQGVTAVVGCSGAGKSTLLNVLVGFEQIDGGKVIWHGGSKGDGAGAGGCGRDGGIDVFWCPQSGGLWAGLTVGEHVRLVCGGKKKGGGACGGGGDVGMWLQRFDLDGKEDVVVGELSGGERARLSLARGLASGCGVLVLDEPLVSVSVGDARRYWEVIRDWRSQTGGHVIFSTHLPEVVMREAEHVVFMDEGAGLWWGEVGEAYDRPIDEKVGRLLGELNWFNECDGADWLGDAWQVARQCFGHAAQAGQAQQARSNGVGVRPERMVVEVDAGGAFVSRGSCRVGVMVETVVRDVQRAKERLFLHAGDVVAAGENVRLAVTPIASGTPCATSEGQKLTSEKQHATSAEQRAAMRQVDACIGGQNAK